MSSKNHMPSITPTPQLAGLDEDSQSSAQEAIPVPYVAGSVDMSVKWISPIYNQYAIEAPSTSRGKK